MLKIKTTGVEDYLDGSANIKTLVIGGPGAGKTRMSSYWPKPIYLDCENGRGSLADRNMPYVEVKASKDMLDALEYLKMLERTPKGQRQFQTVVVDTIDSFQRVVKDEWVRQTNAQAFSGYDAWGYLDAKMGMLLTRLLNLDYNVIVLSHYEDKIYKEGENTVRELKLQLQGKVSEQIFNDFGLVGWLGTYWVAGDKGREERRGLTFKRTPDKPFLKDRFAVTPEWMEITFADSDYQQLFEAFFNRPEFEEFAESQVVGEIPDAERTQASVNEAVVNKPVEGGALPATAPLAPPAVPLDKMLKNELEDKARGLGIQVRGNMLKSELITAIQNAQAQQDVNAQGGAEQSDGPVAPPAKSGGPGTFDATTAMDSIASSTPVDPTSPPSSPEQPATAADAAAASNESSSPTATSSAPEATEAQHLAVEEVAASLGATVIATEPADAPSTPQEATPPTQPSAPSAQTGPSACADCGGDLSAEWADPKLRGYVRLSFVKYRKYLCSKCNPTLNQQ